MYPGPTVRSWRLVGQNSYQHHAALSLAFYAIANNVIVMWVKTAQSGNHADPFQCIAGDDF